MKLIIDRGKLRNPGDTRKNAIVADIYPDKVWVHATVPEENTKNSSLSLLVGKVHRIPIPKVSNKEIIERWYSSNKNLIEVIAEGMGKKGAEGFERGTLSPKAKRALDELRHLTGMFDMLEDIKRRKVCPKEVGPSMK